MYQNFRVRLGSEAVSRKNQAVAQVTIVVQFAVENDTDVSRLVPQRLMSGRQVDDIFRKVGLRHSALSLIQGSSQREAEKAMIDELVKQGITGFTDKAGRDWGLSRYAAMVTRLDRNIGRVLATLDDLKLAGDTIVIFASDHGATFESGNQGTSNFHDSNRPFRGQKRTLWGAGFASRGSSGGPATSPRASSRTR